MKALASRLNWKADSQSSCRFLSRASPTSRKQAGTRNIRLGKSFLGKSFAPSRSDFKVVSEHATSHRGGSVGQGHDPNSRLRLSATSKKPTGHHARFRSTVLHRLQFVLAQLATPQYEATGISQDELSQQGSLFMDVLDHAFDLAEQRATQREKNPLFWRLRDAFIRSDVKGLTKEIRYLFQSFVIRQLFPKKLEDHQKRLLDFRYPHEWFPATRTMQRTIHVHVGPTNSGKTFNALKALENSSCGVYAGPLRLLAAEVFQRLKAKGLPCALITGEEVRIPDDTDRYFSSCTVEMVPLNTRFDVAVIDEIQMMADPERGNAWTTALLGVQANEVHVCGEDRAVSLIQALCASTGDECVIHRYERLSPLKTMNFSIQGNYGKLQKGDAIVSFSRLSLHALKRNIETRTGRRCAIVYGSLPPEVRVQQAALFNDPDNDYDFIVASDAIGMGLNLEIRRVILESISKYDGQQPRLLTNSEIKQIGGRAGRYRSTQDVGRLESPSATVGADKVGYVTTMDRADLKMVHRAFEISVEDIKAAYIQPPSGIIERFASYFPPGTSLSFILMHVKTAAAVGQRYRLNVPDDVLEIADIIQDLPLTIYDRLTFCYLPIALRADSAVSVLRALARVVAENLPGDLLSIREIPLEFLDTELENFRGSGQEYLKKLESLHVAINQYVWLSYRYSGLFQSQELAFHVRQLVEERLISTLERLNFTEEQLENVRKSKRKQAKSWEMSINAIREEEAKEVELPATEHINKETLGAGPWLEKQGS